MTENQCSDIQRQQYRTSLLQRKKSEDDKVQLRVHENTESTESTKTPKLRFMKFTTFDAPVGRKFASKMSFKKRPAATVEAVSENVENLENPESSRRQRFSIRDLKIKRLLKSSDGSEKDN